MVLAKICCDQYLNRSQIYLFLSRCLPKLSPGGGGGGSAPPGVVSGDLPSEGAFPCRGLPCSGTAAPFAPSAGAGTGIKYTRGKSLCAGARSDDAAGSGWCLRLCWQGSASKERPVERVSETDLRSTWRPENAQRNRRFPQKMLEAWMCLTRVKGLSAQRPSDPTEGDSVLPGGVSRGGQQRCHVLVLAEVNNENKTKYIQKMQDLFLFIYFSAT